MAQILVADDNAPLRGLMVEFLREAGHEVVEATDGRQAMTALRLQVFDLVVCDMLMPEADGAEVMQFIRKMPVRPALVMVSGGGQIEPAQYLAMARTMGAGAVLQKPFLPSALIEAVERLLAGRPSPRP